MLPVQRGLYVGGCRCRHRCCLPHRERQQQAHHRVTTNGVRSFAISVIIGLLRLASNDQIAFIFMLMVGFLAFMTSIYAPHRTTRAITANISMLSAALAFCLLVSLYLPAELQWVSYLMFGLIMICLLFGEPNCRSFLAWIHGRIKDMTARWHVTPTATNAQSPSSAKDLGTGQTYISAQNGAVVATSA